MFVIVIAIKLQAVKVDSLPAYQQSIVGFRVLAVQVLNNTSCSCSSSSDLVLACQAKYNYNVGQI